MKTIILATALATIAITAAPAEARTVTLSTNVDFSDLNLGTEQGAAALRHRVKIAIIKMCDSYARRAEAREGSFTACKRSVNVEPTVEAAIARAKTGERGDHALVVAAK